MPNVSCSRQPVGAARRTPGRIWCFSGAAHTARGRLNRIRRAVMPLTAVNRPLLAAPPLSMVRWACLGMCGRRTEPFEGFRWVGAGLDERVPAIQVTANESHPHPIGDPPSPAARRLLTIGRVVGRGQGREIGGTRRPVPGHGGRADGEYPGREQQYSRDRRHHPDRRRAAIRFTVARCTRPFTMAPITRLLSVARFTRPFTVTSFTRPPTVASFTWALTVRRRRCSARPGPGRHWSPFDWGSRTAYACA